MMDLVPKLSKHSRTIIIDFIKDRFREAGTGIAVIGLSGGLDSSLTLGLLAEALGNDKVRSFFLPYSDLSGPDRKFSEKAAKEFKVEHEELDISPIVDSIPLEFDGMIKGNAQARARMMVLYVVANKENGMVIGPSNKTEILLGYFTKFGDGGADIYPIGDLYKTQARSMAEEIGVPAEIIERPPSAGLIKGQTDEGELRIPYPIIDQILYGYLRDLDPPSIADNIDYTMLTVDEMDRSGFEPPLNENMINDVISRIKNSRHKRWSMAIPKLEISTTGFDLRERW
jgi:NAD+ synthase